jgi:Domain of unknown function (DUF4249)
MPKQFRNIIPLFLALVFTACVKKINVNTRTEKAQLVIEGTITTDTVPYTVKLGYSGKFTLANDIPPENKETNATVSIEDDLGNSTSLVHIGDGIYQTVDPTYIGKVGRQYQVKVLLSNGTRYISKPELIKPIVPFTKIGAFWVNDFNLELPSYMTVTVDTKDPAADENYYRWTFDSYIMRETKGVPCGFSCIQFAYCYQHRPDREVRILSDAAVNGNEIKSQPVGRTYIYTAGNPYIEVSQLSISRQAYQFLESYQQQLSRTGSILDPLPASIKGNVYNQDKPSEFALGYFSAASVYRKKIILIPYGVTPYLLDISARSFIPDEFIACFDYFEDTQRYLGGLYPPPPPGWENAEELKVFW